MPRQRRSPAAAERCTGGERPHCRATIGVASGIVTGRHRRLVDRDHDRRRRHRRLADRHHDSRGRHRRNVDRHDRPVDLARRHRAIGSSRDCRCLAAGDSAPARQRAQPCSPGRTTGSRPAATVTADARHARLLIRPSCHCPLPASPCASRYGTAPFKDRWPRPQFRMVFVKPDRLLSPPATFRAIVTAERGIDSSLGRAAGYRPASGVPAPDTLRVPVDDDRAGLRALARDRSAHPIVVAVHGITANAWSFGTVAEHLDGEIGWSPSTCAAAARATMLPRRSASGRTPTTSPP